VSALTDAIPAASAVNPADAFSDHQFFADHPQRCYRIRPGWAIRRRPRGVFLRTPLSFGHRYVDTEASAEAAWWEAAYPFLSPLERQAMAKAARGKSRSPKRGA
jgi:hypothetical protein